MKKSAIVMALCLACSFAQAALVIQDGFEASTTLAGNGWITDANPWSISTSVYGNPGNYMWGGGDTAPDDPTHVTGVVFKDTGYTIQPGDVIDLVFDIADMQTAEISSSVLAKLYYMDGAAAVTLGSVSYADDVVPYSWNDAIGDLQVVASAGSIGKNLFVSFEGNGGDGQSGQRLGIDNVTVSAESTIPLSIALDGPDQHSNLQIGITGPESTAYYIYQSSDLTLPYDRWPVSCSGIFPASNQVDLVETDVTASTQFYLLSEASPIDALPVTELDALALADQVTTYKITDGQELQLHVYFPADLQPGEQRPTLLFIHGGGWTQGAPSVHALESLYFSRRGLVTVTISYNLLPDGGTAADPLECFADVKAAMRYLRDHASELHINPDQIVSSGGSAGGHLAAALATLEDDKTYAPNAMILLYPAFDLVDGWLQGGAICTAAGIDPAAFSPALHADTNTPPTLILAGSNDNISKPATNLAFVESMRELDNSAEFIEYAGKGHALFTRDKTDPYFRATIYYMERFLRELGYLDFTAALPENIQTTVTGRPRIMCVGDSITEGGDNFSIYRPLLNQQLEAAGYRYEFVGSKSSTHDGVVLKLEGYSGNNAEQIATKLQANFPNNVADIVLIHAGHNYDGDALGETVVINKVDAATRSMIATARTHNPEVAILLAQVITSTKLPKYAYIPALNVRLASIAAELNTEAQPVLIVNQADGWDPEADTVIDLVHPSLSGATKMANKWLSALVPLLSE